MALLMEQGRSVLSLRSAKARNLDSCGGKTYARTLDLSISIGQNQFFLAG